MAKLKAVFMFLDGTADPTKHQATVDTPDVTLTVVGVSSLEVAIKTAKQLIREEKADLVELCSSCGYKVASAVSEAIGDQVPVGLVVHQWDNAPKICEVIKKWG
jgi:hypothetical protein|tara:strand:+ start:1804 stop:2115 length:312 start_codon:yes stop_codon:yes gene_type:complete